MQLDRSLYSETFNKETRAALDALKDEVRRLYAAGEFTEDDMTDWGSCTTLRTKMSFLERWKIEHGHGGPT